MLRCLRIMFGLALILSMSGRTVHAQWGWGGWGGWGETPEGSILQGLGAFNIGAGQFNLNTAQANSINVDTYLRWNQYLYEAHQEALRQYVAKRDADAAKNKAAYNQIIKVLRENPTISDVRNGDALNAALDQLTDPRIASSSLKIATAEIPANIIKDIPFRNASEAVTIVLSHVKAATKWPTALEGEQFVDYKKAFEEIADKARKEDEEGDINPDTLKRAHNLVSNLRSKLESVPFDNAKDSQEAQKFVKTVAGLVKMLETPDTREALDQLRMMKTVKIGNLIAFMQVYNLRFGAATTPVQRQIYDHLYPVLDEVRDRVLRESKVDESARAQANAGNVGDFFNKLDLDTLEGKAKKDTPPPPNPQ
jgi:hypothetical protein